MQHSAENCAEKKKQCSFWHLRPSIAKINKLSFKKSLMAHTMTSKTRWPRKLFFYLKKEETLTFVFVVWRYKEKKNMELNTKYSFLRQTDVLQKKWLEMCNNDDDDDIGFKNIQNKVNTYSRISENLWKALKQFGRFME